METILMSIQPKWCEKIFNGEKTIEVRKSAPKPPFKVVVYCTKGKPNLYIPQEHNCFPMDEASQLYFAEEPILQECDNLANGKVIGEFVCNAADTIINLGNAFEIKDKDKAYTNTVARNSCLDFYDLQKYLKNKNGCAIHITDTILYDKPRELGEFRTVRFVRGYHKKNETMIERLQNSKRVEVTYVSKAPQSYMRIEEV